MSEIDDQITEHLTDDIASAITEVESAARPVVSQQDYFRKKTRAEKKAEKKARKAAKNGNPTSNDNEIMGVLKEIKEAMHRGTETPRLRYTQDENGFLKIFGYNTYLFCVNPENKPVVVHYEDPEDATFGQYNGPDATILAPKLDAVSPFNKFLTKPEKATVTEARATRTFEHWVDATIGGCEHNRTDYNISSGYIYRLGQTFWANDWIKYWAEPVYEDKERSIHSRNYAGKPLYQLKMFTSGSKTMDGLGLGETNIRKAMNDKLARNFCTKASELLTLDQVAFAVRDDFCKREQIYYEGADPEDKMINPLFTPNESKTGKAKHWSKQKARRLSQSFNNFVQSIDLQKLKKTGILGLVTTAGKLFMRYRLRAAMVVGAVTSWVGMTFLAAGIFSYVSSRAKTLGAEKFGHKRHHDDCSEDFWTTKTDGLKSKHHHGPLDPAKGHNLRVLRADEAKAQPQHNFEWQEPECPIEAGLHAISDTTFSRRGAEVSAFQMGHCTLVKVTETNGYVNFYAPYDDTEYAILQGAPALDGSEPVLSTIRQAFADGSSPDKPIMKVKQDADGNIYKEFIPTEGLLENMIDEFADCVEDKIWTSHIDNSHLLKDPVEEVVTTMGKVKGLFSKATSKVMPAKTSEQDNRPKGMSHKKWDEYSMFLTREGIENPDDQIRYYNDNHAPQ